MTSGEDTFSLKEDESNWQNITLIRENDVILGRGSRSNQSGNIKFRQLIKDNRFRYLAAPKVDKPKIAEEVVHMWRKMNPPGRFLSPKNEDEEGNIEKKDGSTVWYDVGDKKARLKASMALRERTPEAIHFLQVIRKQEAEEAQRTSMYVRQRLEVQGQFSGLNHSDAQTRQVEHFEAPRMPTDPLPSRRASFAGFSQPRRNSNSYVPYHHRSSTQLQQYPPNLPLQQPTRRSSLMGVRQAQLYMMQQNVEARQKRVQMEIDLLETEDCMDQHMEMRMQQHPPMVGGLPAIPDASEHASEHSVEDNFPIQVQNAPTLNIATKESTPQNILAPQRRESMVKPHSPPSSRSMDQELLPLYQEHHGAPGVLDNYHSLLQEWAEREQNTSEEDRHYVDDDDMESVIHSRKRGVDRTASGRGVGRSISGRGVDRSISGCSVQSNLSELMAMSIISSGTADEDFVSLDNRSGHIVIFD